LKLPGVSLSLHCVPFPETVPYFCVSVQGFTPMPYFRLCARRKLIPSFRYGDQ
jgi:hypothetical protein